MLALAGLGIYGIRASFLLSAGRVRLGPACRRALGHARVALLGALLADVLTRQPSAAGLLDPTALVVVVVAALAARRAGPAAAVPAGLIAIVALGLLA
jgi:branched-subunit amino acid transport protein